MLSVMLLPCFTCYCHSVCIVLMATDIRERELDMELAVIKFRLEV